MKCPLAIPIVCMSVAATGLSCSKLESSRRAPTPAASSRPAEAKAKLDSKELLEPGAVLRPAPKALALGGERIVLAGFMAEMELAPKGGFYLTPRPVRCDEAGGGTADLPPETVFVVTPAFQGKKVPFMRGPLEVTGTFEIGNRTNDDGQVSAFRLILDS